MIKIDILDLSLMELEKIFLELGLKNLMPYKFINGYIKNWCLTLMNFLIFLKKQENY
ncbi:hypothetical protein STRA110950_00430 [Streptobacillus ratti]